MLTTRLTRGTAIFLIIESILLTACAIILQLVFEFPAILTKPAAVVLPLFAKTSAVVVPTYYAFALSSLLLIPLAFLVQRILSPRPSLFSQITVTVGVVTAIFQVLGFIRWPFLMPYLATAYTNPQTSDATRQAIIVFYQAFNVYAGHTIGEHLGFLFNAAWGILVGIAILRSPLFSTWKWVGWLGILFSIGILGNPFGDLGLTFLPTSTAYFATTIPLVTLIYLISYSLWIVWLIVVAVRLLLLNRRKLQSLNTVEPEVTSFVATGRN
jgi:hypothetical protein